MRSASTPGNSGASHAPQAHTTRSASSAGRRRGPPPRRRGAPRPARAGAGRHGLRGERLTRVAGAQDARLGLEEREAHVVDGDAREQLARVDALARDALGAQDRLARGLPAVVAAREPGHARSRRRAPGRSRATAPSARRGRARVPGVGAVAAADQARLVARAGAHVAGRDALDEHDVPAGQRAVACQRGAEHAGADDHERGAAAHRRQARWSGRRSALDAQRLRVTGRGLVGRDVEVADLHAPRALLLELLRNTKGFLAGLRPPWMVFHLPLRFCCQADAHLAREARRCAFFSTRPESTPCGPCRP